MILDDDNELEIAGAEADLSGFLPESSPDGEAPTEKRRGQQPRPEVTFGYACKAWLAVLRARKSASYCHVVFRYLHRLFRLEPQTAYEPMSSLDAAIFHAWLDTHFATPEHRPKAQAVFSGLLHYCWQRGWCSREVAEALPGCPHRAEQD